VELILSLACDDARLRPDGKLDIDGVFNELSAPGFPAAQDRMTVVFVMEWDRDVSGSVPFRADLVDETGQKMLTIQGHTEVHAPAAGAAPATTKLVMPLERVVFPPPGAYHFVLSARGRELHGIPLHVVQVEANAAGGNRPASRG
jgi:hypothetical protein